jgi:hypothetical protein
MIPAGMVERGKRKRTFSKEHLIHSDRNEALAPSFRSRLTDIRPEDTEFLENGQDIRPLIRKCDA